MGLWRTVFLQPCKSIEKDKNDYFTGEPKGTYGIDIFIGEEDYLGKGYGTEVLRLFTRLLFKNYGATKIMIDPDAGNLYAIRSYKKAGFQFVRYAKDDVSGEIMIMELVKP